jgi:hypothetical protein
VILKTDSQVISGHIDKSSKARDPKLEKYLNTVRRLEASFEGFSVKNISRGENEHVDLLAKSAAQGLPLPLEVLGRRQRRHPSLEAFAAAAGPTETKRAGTPFAGLGTSTTKACGDVLPRRVLVQSQGPRAIWPIVTGPAWPPLCYGPNL